MKEYKRKLVIFIIAGETSGDNLGENLLLELKRLSKNEIKIYGVGGEKMISQGLIPLFDIKHLSIMGIFEVASKIPNIFKLLKLSKEKIIEIKPDFVITIDAPGFNLRLQKSIKNLKLKRIHYVAPSVWAWKGYRAKKISKFLDHLLVLYPFEKDFFTVHGLDTTFIGHPIAFDKNYKSNNYYIEESLKDKSLIKIGLLPGSRVGEIDKLMPTFIKSASLISKRYKKVKFYVVSVKGFKNKLTKFFSNSGLNYYITDDQNEKYNIYSKIDFAICASGSVTMELARAGTPMLVLYKLNYITWYIVKFLAKVNTATILNIILKDNFIPELFQKNVNENNIYNIIKNYIDDKDKRYNQTKKLNISINKMKNINGNPSYIAAKTILNYYN